MTGTLFTASAPAATFTNATAGADYATGANWDTAAVPTGSTPAVIGGANPRLAVYSTAIGYTTSGGLTLGTGAGGNGTLTLNGSAGTLTFGAHNIGGSGGAGSLVANAGTITSGDADLNSNEPQTTPVSTDDQPFTVTLKPYESQWFTK